jgi:hypothetical protein
LITLAVVILFGCLPQVVAQQKDGDTTNAGANSNSAPSGRVNLSTIQLFNGEYLEMFGTGTSHGILRGHPSISAIELGTLSADPLMFSTNSVERMRILSNGFVGIGTTNPITPFELHSPDANPYSVGIASTARMRLVNNNTTNNNAVELNFSTVDSSGAVATGIRLVGIFTNHTAGAASADFAMVLRNSGNWFEAVRFAAGGNVGIGTNAPAYKLDVAGPVRSSSGGFVFPDGTVQITAGGGSGGGSSQWITSGANIYYNAGNVGLGTSTPGVALDVAQNRAIRVGNATISSGGDYATLANHGWYNGSAWVIDGIPGAIYNINAGQHDWYTHNAAGSVAPLMRLTADGSLGLGTQSPSSRLHVNGGTIRLASTAGETPFQLYSYANSHSLWLTSGNPNTSEIYLSPAYAVDFDRALALQYTPGTTGAAGGILNIGQFNKNAATFTHGATAFYTNGTERLRINSAGSVGIGTATPSYRLDVQAGQVNASGGLCIAGDCRTAWSQVGGGSSQWTTSGANIYYNGGSVGIGSNNPTATLTVSGAGASGTAMFSGSAIASHFNYNGDGSEDTYIRGGRNTSRVVINDLSGGNVLVAPNGGNVGVGTGSPTSKLHVAGDGRFTGSLTVDGNIAAKYQDVAEWVPAAAQLAAGTVVVLDSTTPNQVVSSSISYDTRVAGVVSAQPGITLGEQSENKVLVATTGRVRVKVDATNGPIEIGDLLVTSTREGFAMKSMPVEIGGSRIHRPGTLIGKALESLARGTGEILVLLSLQ